MIFGRVALEMARETIQDLRRRLDDATADNRLLQQQLLQRPPTNGFTPETPSFDVMADFTVPSIVMDEIELVSSSLAMTRHLEKWALGQLRKGVEQSTVIEQIREGDTVTAPAEDDE